MPHNETAKRCEIQVQVHTKFDSTDRYLGVEMDDALELAEQTEV
jgi:hypothetical protein